ncbi:uncharacterized protein [Gossypium hirsutum]|uniref:Retrotransposon gag domain-containing protein n=1 Tax=Gossypium hirsutum TaxID=3635 RepID=A0ABM3AZM4_GOSHI|nr:uncharacterized protein LOC121223197 [Gossypium hirsutum]
MNYLTGSSSNLRNDPTDLVVLDLDEMVEARVELPKQLEDRYRWVEEKLKVMENADYHCGVDAKGLSLVPDLVFPPKFKAPEFEKYNGTNCLEAHITMFCRRMTGYIDNDQLLIHCFQDSLIGSAAKWYNQLSRANIHSWKDLAQAFMKQYGHVEDMAHDKITLMNLEKKQTPFINHMLGRATMSFSDMVMSGEMIENAIRSGKIDSGESVKGLTLKNKENEVSNLSMYNEGYPKSVTMGQPRVITAGYQSINIVSKKGVGEENTLGIVLNSGTAEKIPVFFRANSE